MLVYVIRHAQSRNNTGEDASLNSALSHLGAQQVAALARRFSGMRVAAVYSSPFHRCLETAVPVARAVSHPVLVRPELCEFHGLPDGPCPPSPLAESHKLAAEHENVVLDPEYKQPFAWPPLNESHSDMIARLRAMADFLKRRWTNPDDIVLLFSHGSPIARLIDAWLTDSPGPSFRFIIDNATVSALRYDNGLRSLICLNEASHLAGLAPAAQSNFDSAGHVKTAPPTKYW